MIEPWVAAVAHFGPDQVRVSLRVPSDHPAFAGHFPGQPILPGVVQIDWATQLAVGYLGSGFRAGCDFQVKFRKVIIPDTILSLDLRFDRPRRILEFSYRIGDTVASSGQIRPEAT